MWQWAILYALMILTVILLADTQRRLGIIGKIYDIPYGDKAAHFLLYGTLTLLANLSVAEARPRWSTVIKAGICSTILVVLIGLEELSQKWLPLRRASVTDLVSSYLGVAVFTLLAVWIWRRRSRRPR